jgi:uncharacterized protein (DUF952 family)
MTNKNNSKKNIYKICDRKEWEIAKEKGVFKGSGIDLTDGFIHFSTLEQVQETSRLHFNGVKNLLLIEVNTEKLDIKWELSRNNTLFPHLYDAMPLSHVVSVFELKLDKNNNHILPSKLYD